MFLAIFRLIVVAAFIANAWLVGLMVVRPSKGSLCVAGAAGIVLVLTGITFAMDWLTDLSFRLASAADETRPVRVLALVLSPFDDLDTDEAGAFVNRMLRIPFLWAGIIVAATTLLAFVLHRESIYLTNAGYLLVYLVLLFVLLIVFRAKFPAPGIDYL